MDLDIEVDGWPSAETDWADLAERAHAAAETVEPALANPRLTASVLFTVDDEVQALNKEWRAKDRPTNVLSFPMMDLEPGERPGPLLGDLVLAFETCAREASSEGKSFADHFRHLLVHGFLHCLGHDHVEDEDAEAMEALEVRILSAFSIADPYREDGSPGSEETPGLEVRDDVSDTVER